MFLFPLPSQRLDVFATFEELLRQTERAVKLNLHDGRAMLRPHVDAAVSTLAALTRKRHPETKTAAIGLIRAIAGVLGGGLDEQFSVVVAAVSKLFKVHSPIKRRGEFACLRPPVGEKGMMTLLRTFELESLSATVIIYFVPDSSRHDACVNVCG